MKPGNEPGKRGAFRRLNVEIQQTADGSHTLFVPGINERYHSVNGAIQESLHVFINAGLRHLARERVRILEIGFGTGLNALLSLLEADRTEKLWIEYHAAELYPLPVELAATLNYGELLCPGRKELFDALHTAPWDEYVRITPHFMLHKIEGDCNRCELPGALDLVYFDAFAPDKQPEMWNQEIFDALYRLMAHGGVMTTYCAKGAVRRMMQKAGYSVERIPGPHGKREMLRANY
ncbi:MAG: tRNA (5-methylaminomethyl-2-thiouridine)(34)-methyltransferase MnmD [Tannerellaceae bacterium]|jgi:tRNA U34 5-methylaminomethyl-2-thiouridine-forming methyltransferase MnmC|nr:tRNA (5-methylaminomethyl-2-thiouridine)(34)-methyltransferase MnmD [Tannerellaceae bacterium]